MTNLEAPLRPVGGVADIQVVGALSERVIGLLGFHTPARSVWLHQDAAGHIVTRRQEDAEFILEHLPRAVLYPDFVGLEFSDPRRARLVYRVESHDCFLHVCIKLVRSAESGLAHDELWISTAYRIGLKSLTRLRNKATLWRVELEADRT